MFPSIVAVLVVILCIRYIYNYVTFWRHFFKIPGPKSVPILGNAFIGSPSSVEVFIRDRRYAKEFKDIYNTWGLTLAEVSLINPSDIEQVITNSAQNTKSLTYDILKPWLGTGLLTSAGSKWQARRKILTPAFHFNILKEFIHIFNRETKSLIAELHKLCSKPYVNILEPITEFTLSSIAETSMGVTLSESTTDNDLYKKAVHDMGSVIVDRVTKLWLFIPVTYFFSSTRKLEKTSLDILHEMSRSVIEERKAIFREQEITHLSASSYSAKKRLAMLDLLLKYKQEGADIDDEGIREEVDTFMFEGHDTTSMALCFALMVLANHPNVQNQILEEINDTIGEDQDTPTSKDFQEMKYMERCIKECLRLYPSVPSISRIAGESFTTKSGYFVPEGTNVNILIYDLHHREDIYENPEKFDPDRFLPENSAPKHPFAFIPFSAGPRNCIGQKFAILEMKAALCGILRNFKLEPVDTPQTIRIKTDLVLRPEGEIRVKLIPRKL